MFKRILVPSLIMLAVMLLLISGSSVQAVACAESANIVAFGDSITHAYGLTEEQSYVHLYAESQNLSYINYAVDGMTTQGLIDMLEADDYSDSVGAASCVFVYIGANDILSVLGQEITDKIGAADITNESMTSLYEILNSKDFNEKLQAAVDNFAMIYPLLIKKLHEMNESIILFTIYNPYSGMRIDNPTVGSESLNLGIISEIWIEKLNVVIKKQTEYRIVDVFDAFESNFQEQQLVNANITNAAFPFSVDPHPTLDGQKLIADSLKTAMAVDKEYVNNQDNSDSLKVYSIVAISIASVLLVSEIGILSREFIRKKRNIKIDKK